MENCKVIAITNQKGGVGKTTKQIIMLFTPDEYSASVRAMYDGSAEVRELSLSEDESHVEGIED